MISVMNGSLIARLRISAFIGIFGMLITLCGMLVGISHGRTFFDLTGSQR